MSIRVRCTKCAAEYNLADKLAGKKIRCKKCETAIAVPAEEIQELGEELAVTSAKEKAIGKAKTSPARVVDREDEPRRKRRSDEEDEETSRTKKLPMPWIIGGSVGAVLLIVGIVVAIVMTRDKPDPDSQAKNGETTGQHDKNDNKAEDKKKKQQDGTGSDSTKRLTEDDVRQAVRDYARLAYQMQNADVEILSALIEPSAMYRDQFKWVGSTSVACYVRIRKDPLMKDERKTGILELSIVARDTGVANSRNKGKPAIAASYGSPDLAMRYLGDAWMDEHPWPGTERKSWGASPDPGPIYSTADGMAGTVAVANGNLQLGEDVFNDPSLLHPSTASPFALVRKFPTPQGNGMSQFQVFDLRSLKSIGPLVDLTNRQMPYALSSDGTLLATGEKAGGGIQVWSMVTGKPKGPVLREFKVQSFDIVDFLNGGQVMVVHRGQDICEFHIFDPKTAKARSFSHRVQLNNRIMALSPNRRYLACQRSSARLIDLIDLQSGKSVGDLKLPAIQGFSDIDGLAFSADGKMLSALVDTDVGKANKFRIFTWDMATGNQLSDHQLPEHKIAKRAMPITRHLQWLPDNRGWLVYEHWWIDAKNGKEIAKIAEAPLGAFLRYVLPNGYYINETGRETNTRTATVVASPIK